LQGDFLFLNKSHIADEAEYVEKLYEKLLDKGHFEDPLILEES